MKRTHKAMPLVIVILFSSSPALAYVDPGSGSLIIQMLVAGAVGVMFYFRQFREKVKSLFVRQSEKDVDEADSFKDDAPK